jgi:SAM-dependent methyltransferase
MQEAHDAIYALLKDKQKGTLLDLACGQGQLGEALGEVGFKVFFTDGYETPLNRSRHVEADLNDPLPFKKGIIDNIVCADSLQYLKNHEAFFSETNRLLASKGRLVISFPNVLTLSERFYFLRRGWFSCFRPIRKNNRHSEWANGVYHVFSFVEVYQLLKKNGFEIIKVFSPDISKKDWWFYLVMKGFYSLGLIFDRDIEKGRLIKWLMSRDLLCGDHLIIYSKKK